MNSRNVLYVTIDGLRYDRLASNGYKRSTTPTIDAIASEGSVCDHTIATGPGTRVSFPSLLTSSFPMMYGGYIRLTEHRAPLSSAFRSEGYATAGINTNAQLTPEFGWDRGFDVYVDRGDVVVNTPVGDYTTGTSQDTSSPRSLLSSVTDPVKRTIYDSLDSESLVFRFLEGVYRRFSSRSLPHPDATDVVDTAVDAVDRLPDDRPFFVWVHFMEPHSPYDPPADYRDRFLTEPRSTADIWSLNDRLHTKPDSIDSSEVEVLSNLYDASLRYLDDELGRLVDELRARDLWSDLTFALSADHGEEFREHGGLTHCALPYEVGVHVPLLFRLPGDVDHADIPTVTSTTDIPPTLLEASVTDPDIPDRFHGRSLLQYLRGDEEPPADRTVICELTTNPNISNLVIDPSTRTAACQDAEWKYITSRRAEVPDTLFHLASDPGEQDNVAAEHPDVVAEFEAKLRRHYDQAAYDFEIEDSTRDSDVERQLEALGYKT